MNDPYSKDPPSQLDLVRDLLADNATVDGDVLRVGTDTWALHGTIPVDGEVLMAEFGTYDEAQHALDELHGGLRPTSDQ
jgi:hypothetical protein